MRKIMIDNYFDLDFDAPNEIENEIVEERNLYPQLLKDGFKFTDTPAFGAGYIMQDGKFLFLENNRNLLTADKITHFYLITKGYIQDTSASRVLCQTDNAIRINDGINFSYEALIGLPKNKLTVEQERSLEAWLYYMLEKNKYLIQVGNELVAAVFQIYNLKEQMPEKVISKIKTYYNNGVLREAKDIKGEANNGSSR